MTTPTHKLLALFILGLVFALSVATAQSKPDFSGTWKADIAKSDFGSFPPPQSTVTKINHKDPNLKISSTSVSDRGEQTMELTFTTDGAENTNQIGNIEVKSKLKWEGAALLIESKASTEQGEFTVKEKWTLSDDGKTLTIVRNWASPMGETTQTVVHGKQ
jgi:hypothetical protein